MLRCATHTVADTGLVCGRCETPVCGRCVVPSVVGTRCQNCAPQTGHRRISAASGPVPAGADLWRVLSCGPARVFYLVAALVMCPAFLAYSWLQGDRELLIIRATVYGGWVVTLVMHELAHGLAAYAGGDKTVRDRGFLTLNPLKYMDPVMSIAVPLVLVMLGGIPLIGGRTLIESHRLKSRWWDTGVSLAGPAANLTVALVIGALFRAGMIDPYTPFGAGMAFLGVLQVAAAMFNLIPVPPMDGFGAIAPHLSEGARTTARSFGFMGYFVVLGAFWFLPGAGDVFWEEVWETAYRLDIPGWSAAWGEWGARFRFNA